MHLAPCRQPPWLAVLVAGLAAGLLVPAAAGAKVSCEAGEARATSLDLHGLPMSPVAGRTYSLWLATRTEALNPRPALMTVFCGGGTPMAETTPANGGFRRAGRGVFAMRLRFPQAGPWAVSVMDLDGSFYDLGRREVRSMVGAVVAAFTGSQVRL